MSNRVRPPADVSGSSPDPADSDDAGSLPPPSAAQTAEYVASLTGELAELARKTGLETLAYLLEMARFEAAAHIEGKSTERGR